MKNALVMVTMILLSLMTASAWAVVVFDESLPGVWYGEDSGAGYEAGAQPDDGSTPNAMQFGFFGSVGGDVTLEAGQAYKVIARRKVSLTYNVLGFDVTLNGSKILRDTAPAAGDSENDTFKTITYPGIYTPQNNTVSVALLQGGVYFSRVDWIRFEPTEAVIFDESTPGLSGTSYGVGYEAGASPDNGSTPNMIGFGGGANATASLSLQVGQKYKVYARRRVLANSNLSFYVDFDGVYYMWDSAFNAAAPDTFQESQYLGYFVPQNASTVVNVRDGGPWVTRLDYVLFVPTADAYLDENTADLSFTGTAGFTHINWTMPISLTNNGMGLGPTDTVSGTVSLIPGRTYNVYASRTVHSSGNLSYDLSLGGAPFVHDAALAATTAQDDATVESPLGQYVAADAATAVQLSNGGPWAARVDYIRFELVEPAACGEEGTVYLSGDLNKDCAVNIEDLQMFLLNWLECTDPAQAECN